MGTYIPQAPVNSARLANVIKAGLVASLFGPQLERARPVLTSDFIVVARPAAKSMTLNSLNPHVIIDAKFGEGTAQEKTFIETFFPLEIFKREKWRGFLRYARQILGQTKLRVLDLKKTYEE